MATSSTYLCFQCLRQKSRHLSTAPTVSKLYRMSQYHHGSANTFRNKYGPVINTMRHKTTLANMQKKEPNWFETQRTPSWETKNDLVRLLMKNKIYEDGHVLVLNKPGGLPMQSAKYTEDYSEMGVPDGDNMSVASLLPDLRKSVNTDVLDILYSQHRLYSGIIVLSKTEIASDVLSKYFVHVKTNNVEHQKYWAITVGIPEPRTCETQTLNIARENIDGQKIAFKHKKPSLKEKKRHNMVQANVSMNMLKTYKSSQYSVSLVELSPSTIKWDALQLFMLHKLSPALGDHKYSSRLRSILGNLSLMDYKTHVPAPQVLPYDLQKRLGLMEHEDTSVIPLHIHCGQLNIPKVTRSRSHRKSEILGIQTLPPNYFQRTMTLFNLVPEGFHNHDDEKL